MKKLFLALFIVSFATNHSFSQNVGIGTSQPHSSAKLEVSSTKSGFLPPRLTTGQRDSIVNPAEGLQIYNSSSKCLEIYILGGWRTVYCYIPPVVSVLECTAYSLLPVNISPGVSYAGSLFVPYLGGNGKEYPAGLPIASSGVTGLTATLKAGTLATGAGTLTFSLSGTPSGAGTAAFPITFGGKSCVVSINISSAPTIVGKWYYQSVADSAFCCLNLPEASRYAYPDSTVVYNLTTNTYYYNFFSDNTFTEYYFDNQLYNGTYTYGYNNTLQADTLNTIYNFGNIPYRVELMSANVLKLSEKPFYKNDMTGSGVLPNGDTLMYKRVWTFNK